MAIKEFLVSRMAKDWLKAVLAFVLATTFILSPWSSWIQSRTFGNVILVTVIQSPAKSVGSFLDSSFLLLVFLFINSAIFAFMQAVAGNSYPALGVILFLVTYISATIRTFNVQRYFVPSLVGPLLAFTACTSLVGVGGRNSSGGAQFDNNFLISTINSYLIGLAISFILNILVFPDFAEPRINQLLITVLANISDLSSSILKSISGAEITKEDYAAGNEIRTKLVVEIQNQFRLIDTNIAQAAAEVSYSCFSVKNYGQIVKGCKSIASVLFSLQTTLSSVSAQQLLASKEFANEISPRMRGSWIKLDSACKNLFDEVATEINDRSKSNRIVDKEAEEALAQSLQVAQEAIVEFENHNPSVFLKVFSEKKDISEGLLTNEVKAGWGKLLQLTFFILGSKEIVKELTTLHTDISQMSKSRKIRLHFGYFAATNALKRFVSSGSNNAGWSIRGLLVAAKDFVLSPGSIFGIKSAVALVCLQLILFNRPDIFKQWYLASAVTTILVAVSPSMGQTYLGLPIQIIGSSVGAILGYAGVVACGKTSYGLVGFAFLVAVPGYYLQLKGLQTFVLGLLMLMSFSTYVAVSNANAINPFFDAPDLYLGKTIGALAVTLTFSVVFSMVLYPTLARDVLRERMCEIFQEISMFYRKIIVATVNVPVDSIHVEQDVSVKEARNQILTKLLALENLVVFASAEPRLEGKFETAKYRAVLASQHRLLDRIDCLRMSAGDKPLDNEVRTLMNRENIGKARSEMQQTFRLLLYVYASTLLTKQKIPPGLPKAAEVRNKLAEEIIMTVMKHHHGLYPAGDELDGIIPKDQEGILRILNTEKWMRIISFSASAREVAQELDRITPQMVAIFGSFADVLTKEADFVVEENEWLI
ncbi:hypothetical protein HDU99_007326 [Rhizoclosmatium hyalinum]|nr:hypothetical protein HDU99_007326 [Rhizoclosmatium hyalinum]